MWSLQNNTPFAAERAWVRDKNGAEVWLVAVKGTFDINPDGTLSLAENQQEVCLAPKYSGDPQNLTLLYDSDLHHLKFATDIVMHAHAYAPKGQPVKRLDVMLKVENMTKKLRVSGDRYWTAGLVGLSMTQPEPFTKIPISYDRAFGGIDTKSDDPNKHGWEPRNPVGSGFSIKKNHIRGRRLPNVEYPKSLVKSWGDRPQPAGFGPIAGHWSPRVELAGTYDEKWEKERQPLLAEDFDERFYQSAPADQQVPGFLKGGELVELFNLTPGGLLRFRLPRVTLNFTTNFGGNDQQEHRADLHTVAIEPDIPRVMMVWHTKLPCHHKVLKLLNTTIDMKKRINVPSREEESGLWFEEA